MTGPESGPRPCVSYAFAICRGSAKTEEVLIRPSRLITTVRVARIRWRSLRCSHSQRTPGSRQAGLVCARWLLQSSASSVSC